MLTDEQIKNRKTWTDALRSGNYAQGTKRLVTISEDGKEPEYCCLGVAKCVVPGLVESGSGFYLASETLGLLGLTTETQGGLAILNDRGWSFERIADLIDSDTIPPTAIEAEAIADTEVKSGTD